MLTIVTTFQKSGQLNSEGQFLIAIRGHFYIAGDSSEDKCCSENTGQDLNERGIGLKILPGQVAAIDTTTPAGKLVFDIFAALAEFERELISECTRAGLASVWARGRKGGQAPA